MKRHRNTNLVTILLTATFALGSAMAQAAEIRTQRVRLAAGWNLVSFQVFPADPSPAVVFGSLGANFVLCMTYDAETQTWEHYCNPAIAGATAGNAVAGGPLVNVVPGWGYLVQVQQAWDDWEITGTAMDQPPTLQLSAGWNLVGFGVGQNDLNAPFNLQEYLAGVASGPGMVLSLNPLGYDKLSLPSPGTNDFLTGDPNKGYWIYSPRNRAIAPDPLASLPWAYFTNIRPLVARTWAQSVANVPIHFKRPFSGTLKLTLGGSAQHGVDYTVPGFVPDNRTATINVASPLLESLIPVSLLNRGALQRNVDCSISVVRPTGVAISRPDYPETCRIIITDGDLGTYQGLLTFSPDLNLPPQRFLVAMRKTPSAEAVFEARNSHFFSGRFALPASFPAGGGFTLSQSPTDVTQPNATLNRSLQWQFTPGAIQALANSGTPPTAFEVPLALSLGNVIASPETLNYSATLFLSQADAATLP